MAAVVTDQFRILNASNFIDSVLDDNNSYYVFLGLPNSSVVGFGRTSDWSTATSGPPSPTDNFEYLSQYRDTGIFGKKVSSANIRRVIRKVQWTTNTAYDMYRHDYSSTYTTPNSGTSRLYDSNYYVINSDFRVYICIDNGGKGTTDADRKGGRSKFEPTSTDLQPFSAGSDGYLWKYLFSISPSDVIKFDSTEYIVLPNNWETSTNSDIQAVREAGDSDTQNNQIKKVYIKNAGLGYTSGTFDILGDGEGGKVDITVDSSGAITSTNVTTGGKNYTFGIVDLGRTGTISSTANLVPIIPPSKGHGYDVYTELGADRVLIYARFDDSTKDFPVDAKFAQVGIIKNPTSSDTGIGTFTGSTYSSLYALKLNSSYTGTPTVGEEVTQSQAGAGVTYTARGYVASYDSSTKVLKYFKDRSLFLPNKLDQTDATTVKINSKIVDFNNTDSISFTSATSTSVASGFTGSSENGVSLGVQFTGGLANPEINKKTGDIIYIDNRPEVERNLRQKEDVKIILEF
jgi:hypothetical protein